MFIASHHREQNMNITTANSKIVFELFNMQSSDKIGRKIWLFISSVGCCPCNCMEKDLSSMSNYTIRHPIYHVEISKIGPDEERLLKFCNAGQFPFLCFIENGTVKRRWAGYFVDEEESFRIEQLKSILSSE
jgi:hypothetical protein